MVNIREYILNILHVRKQHLYMKEQMSVMKELVAIGQNLIYECMWGYITGH